MTRHDIPWLSAAETAVAIKTKQVSPVEVVQAYLARIELRRAAARVYYGHA